MINYKDILSEYALRPYRYTKYKNIHIIDCEEGRFVIKRKTRNLNSVFNYLLSRNFKSFVAPIENQKGNYYLIPYIENLEMPREQKMRDLIILLALLHNKTTYFKEIDPDYYKEIYEELKEKADYAKKYYYDLINYIETEIYMSPFEYLLARNINKVLAATDYALFVLDMWYEKISTLKKVRTVTLHGNLELDHFLKNNEGFFISWEKTYQGMPIYDLIDLYNRHWQEFDFVDIFDLYEEKYPLREEERLLLSVYLTIPKIINIDFNEYEICKELTLLLDYLYKTEEILLAKTKIREEIYND
jgi:spore coat protein YsxE